MTHVHQMMVVAFDGVVLGDLAMPCEIFQQTERHDGQAAYQVTVCGAEPTVRSRFVTMSCDADLSTLAQADTIIVPGLIDVDQPPPPALIGALTLAAVKGTRIASIGSGAFILAAAGLLNGLRATTHWQAAPLLAERYPQVEVDANALYVDNGQILTSAGANAGVDLCLHMIANDVGETAAVTTAKAYVVPLQREGGQALYIDPLPSLVPATPLAPLLEWISQNLTKSLDIATLCKRSGFDQHALHQHFEQETGMPPTEWIRRCRVQQAQVLLESTDLSLEQVAQQSGIGSLATLRTHFAQALNVSPSQYRRAFRRT